MSFTLALLFLGLVAGQFLNLAAAGTGRDTGSQLSACVACGRLPVWTDFVPILPWLVPASPCPRCETPRPYREALVSLLTGALFALAAIRLGPSFELVRVLLGTMLILVVALSDLLFWIMPFEFTLPGVLLGVVVSFFSREVSWVQSLLGVTISFAFLMGVELLAKRTWGGEPLGGGVKFFVAMTSAFLGASKLPALLLLCLIQIPLAGWLLMSFRGSATLPTEIDPSLLHEAEQQEGEQWAYTPTMIQTGPFIALSALELLFAEDLLRRMLPGAVAHFFLG